jgi:transposase InsO family protein
MAPPKQPSMEERIDKWGWGIELKEDTKREDITDYIYVKTYEWETDKSFDSDLWELCKDALNGWEERHFGMARTKHLQSLRRILRCGGICIRTSQKGQSLANALYTTFLAPEPPVWTPQDLEDAKTDLCNGSVTSQNPIVQQFVANANITSSSSLQPSYGHQYTPPSTIGASRTASQTPSNRGTTVEPPPITADQYQNGRANQETGFNLPDRENRATSVETTVPTSALTVHKQLMDISKVFPERMKFDGYNINFTQTVIELKSYCERVGLPEKEYPRALEVALKDTASDHYRTHQLAYGTFDNACNSIKTTFQGAHYQKRMLKEWESFTFATLRAQHPDKRAVQVIPIFTNKLRELQYSLPIEAQTDYMLLRKIIGACDGYKPLSRLDEDTPGTSVEVIQRMTALLTAHPDDRGNDQTYFTDRRYHTRSPQRGRSRPRGRNHYLGTHKRPSNKCFICGKEGCRRWKHPQDEQDAEQARFEATKGTLLHENLRSSKRRFTKRYNQWAAYCEGDADLDELDPVFEALFIRDDMESIPDTEDFEELSNELVQTTFFTSSDTFPEALAAPIATELANQAFTHRLTAENHTEEHDKEPPDKSGNAIFNAVGTSRYDSTQFRGIIIDTGAAGHSTAGFEQFTALQRIDNTVKLDTTNKGSVSVSYGPGKPFPSIGSTIVETPIGHIEFHVMEAQTPFLLCLNDLDKLDIYANNVTNRLVTPTKEVPLIRKYGHLVMAWNTSLQSHLMETLKKDPCYLTDVELKRLHRRFGHPSVQRLRTILTRADQEVNQEALEQLTKLCHHCQKHGKSPGRFRFHLKDDVSFNHTIIVDIFYLEGRPVLHVVDEATGYQAGRFLTNISAKHTWDALRACWIDVYLGPPDEIVTDAGKNFVSKEFQQHATAMGVTLKTIPVEAHHSIGKVERYHTLVKRAYEIIIVELPDLDKDMALQMAFKAVNDSAGPDGLIPTLLVYGAYPRMSEFDAPAPTVTQRATAIRKAMEELAKVRAKRQVQDALNMRNGPNTDGIHELTLNSDVLVWREGNVNHSKGWDGPYKLISMDGETCVVAQPRGHVSFRSTSVKPYYAGQPDPDLTCPAREIEPITDHLPSPDNGDAITVILPPEQPVKRGRGRPRKYPPISTFLQEQEEELYIEITIFLQSDELQLQPFAASRLAEVTGLKEKGVFKIVLPEDVPIGIRIFDVRFVDEIKNPGTEKAFEKSRLVVQAYRDDEKHTVLTQSPTIQRVSQRIILCIGAMRPGKIRLYLRDISQAYVQSNTLLIRGFYVRATGELARLLGVEEGTILQIMRPLYGIPESGNHWFHTYHSHHTTELGMEPSTYDPCLLCRKQPFGVVGLQTDDTLFVGDEEFAELEQQQLHKAKFMAKDRDTLTQAKELKFNGGIIQLTDAGITLTQQRQCELLQTVQAEAATTTSSRGAVRHNLTMKEQYISQRARGAYIASVCQPEASYDLSVAAQAIQPDADDVKALNQRLDWQVQNASRGLTYVQLDQTTLQLMVFTDASFANNRDFSSQMGYVIALTDREGNANVLHWSSIKCKRITRSVLASELYAMAHGFDMGIAIKTTIERILGTELPLVLCTDSRSLYDCLVKLGTTQEKRLMIDIMCLRQAYERRQIAEVRWIDGNTNPADSMTKKKPSTALKQLLDTNKVRLETKEWVERGAVNEGAKKEESRDLGAKPE